jgi:NAD(P)-dependent dehydrogenase (short-subunit alcohol dehydrogenase family)
MPKVIITGISRGIGKATAQRFLKKGWEVFGTSTSGKAEWEDENLHVYLLDLADPKSITKFAQEVVKDAEEIDVLINNAGMQLGDGGLDWTADDLRKTLEVNLIGPADLTLKLIPHIKKVVT